MKFLEILGKEFYALWKLCLFSVKVALIASLALFVLTMLMPENAAQAVDLVKGLFNA